MFRLTVTNIPDQEKQCYVKGGRGNASPPYRRWGILALFDMKDIAELEQEIILNKTEDELKTLIRRFNEAFEERDTNAMLNLTYDMIDAITFEKSAGDFLSSLNLRNVKRVEGDETGSAN